MVKKGIISYMLHSCWEVQLSVIGQGNETIDLVVLSVQTVTINKIFVKKINMYTDAKETCVDQLRTPLQNFQISVPGTAIVIRNGTLDSGGQNLEGPATNSIFFCFLFVKDH